MYNCTCDVYSYTVEISTIYNCTSILYSVTFVMQDIFHEMSMFEEKNINKILQGPGVGPDSATEHW